VPFIGSIYNLNFTQLGMVSTSPGELIVPAQVRIFIFQNIIFSTPSAPIANTPNIPPNIQLANARLLGQDKHGNIKKYCSI
jgi:hypothetical protein